MDPLLRILLATLLCACSSERSSSPRDLSFDGVPDLFERASHERPDLGHERDSGHESDLARQPELGPDLGSSEPGDMTPAIETCANAVAVAADVVTQEVTFDLASHSDDHVGSCQGSGSADAVFYFTLTSTSSVFVEVVPPEYPGSGYVPAIYVRRTSCTGPEQSCIQSYPNVSSTTVFLGSLASDTYYVFVDGNPGTYLLRLTAQ